jgi:hypothetical protein
MAIGPSILQQENALKDLSTQALQQMLRQPSPNAPPFLVASELSRREKMEREYAGMQAQAQTAQQAPTVAHRLSGMAQPVPISEMGAMAAPPQQAPMPQQGQLAMALSGATGRPAPQLPNVNAALGSGGAAVRKLVEESPIYAQRSEHKGFSSPDPVAPLNPGQQSLVALLSALVQRDSKVNRARGGQDVVGPTSPPTGKGRIVPAARPVGGAVGQKSTSTAAAPAKQKGTSTKDLLAALSALGPMLKAEEGTRGRTVYAQTGLSPEDLAIPLYPPRSRNLNVDERVQRLIGMPKGEIGSPERNRFDEAMNRMLDDYGSAREVAAALEASQQAVAEPEGADAWYPSTGPLIEQVAEGPSSPALAPTNATGLASLSPVRHQGEGSRLEPRVERPDTVYARDGSLPSLTVAEAAELGQQLEVNPQVLAQRLKSNRERAKAGAAGDSFFGDLGRNVRALFASGDSANAAVPKQPPPVARAVDGSGITSIVPVDGNGTTSIVPNVVPVDGRPVPHAPPKTARERLSPRNPGEPTEFQTRYAESEKKRREALDERRKQWLLSGRLLPEAAHDLGRVLQADKTGSLSKQYGEDKSKFLQDYYSVDEGAPTGLAAPPYDARPAYVPTAVNVTPPPVGAVVGADAGPPDAVDTNSFKNVSMEGGKNMELSSSPGGKDPWEKQQKLILDSLAGKPLAKADPTETAKGAREAGDRMRESLGEQTRALIKQQTDSIDKIAKADSIGLKKINDSIAALKDFQSTGRLPKAHREALITAGLMKFATALLSNPTFYGAFAEGLKGLEQVEKDKKAEYLESLKYALTAETAQQTLGMRIRNTEATARRGLAQFQAAQQSKDEAAAVAAEKRYTDAVNETQRLGILRRTAENSRLNAMANMANALKPDPKSRQFDKLIKDTLTEARAAWARDERDLMNEAFIYDPQTKKAVPKMGYFMEKWREMSGALSKEVLTQFRLAGEIRAREAHRHGVDKKIQDRVAAIMAGWSDSPTSALSATWEKIHGRHPTSEEMGNPDTRTAIEKKVRAYVQREYSGQGGAAQRGGMSQADQDAMADAIRANIGG